MVMVWAGLALLVLSGVLLFLRRSQESKLLQINATETSTAKSLLEAAKYVSERLGEAGSFNQVAEVKGLLKCDSPLTSELAGQPCAYYNMTVTREYEETYWETDSKTNERIQRTRRSSEQVAGNSQRVPFWVEDATGRTLVNPDHAEIDAVKAVERFEDSQGLSGGVLQFGSFSLGIGDLLSGMSGSRTLGYRLQETLLPLDRRVYVLGEARDASGQLAIEKPRESGKKFIISLKSEEELVASTGSAVRWLLVGAVASGIVGLGLIVAGFVR